MEGIGYWLFLLVLYSLSMLAKKRKQKQAWQELEQQEEGQPPPQQPTMPGFLQDIFDDMVETKAEAKIKGEPEYDEEITIEPPPSKPVYVQPKPVEYEHSIKWKHSQFSEPKKAPTTSKLMSALKHPNGLKQAILLKEILGKPRALRKKVR